MNSGHPGSMGTIHADGPRQALSKLRTYAMAAEERLTSEVVTEMIAETLDVIVQLRSEPDGKRSVCAVSEVAGMEAGRALINDLFSSTGWGPAGWTGLVPRSVEKLTAAGLDLAQLEQG
jgi:pilus assembly protein CpaF